MGQIEFDNPGIYSLHLWTIIVLFLGYRVGISSGPLCYEDLGPCQFFLA